MKRIGSRVLLVAILLVLSASMVAAAGSAEGEDDPVELIMYLIGEPDVDWPDVRDAVNEILAERYGATVQFNLIGWGDFETKYNLVLSSGEPVDLLYAAHWLYYTRNAVEGGFLALDDLLPEAAPKLDAMLTDTAREQCAVRGELFMMPATSPSTNAFGFGVRGDLREKYGIGPIETMEDFAEYLIAIQDEPGMIPYNAGSADTGNLNAVLLQEEGWSYNGFDGTIFHELEDPEDIFSWYLSPEFAEFARRTAQLSAMGLWPQGVLSNQTGAREAFINGTSGAVIDNLSSFNEAYKQIVADHPEWEPEWFLAAPDMPIERGAYYNDGMAVGATSAHPEKALEVLQAFVTDEDIYRLMFYGIEGVHYTVTAAGNIAPAPGGNSYAGEELSIWGIKNPALGLEPADVMPGFEEWKTYMEDQGMDNAYAMFTFDTSDLETELATIESVEAEYGDVLVWGLASDVDAALEEFGAQLENAGVFTVLEAAEEQAAAFRAGM